MHTHAMGCIRLFEFGTTLLLLVSVARAADIFYEWNVSVSRNIRPLYNAQPVITINGMFPGPLINATTNDYVHVNIFNNLDEPFLMTWNGIQQRLNSWQDGVSGTNCPIQPGQNWTYVFETKDQIGSFFYFPSLNFQKAAGGYGPIRVNNRRVIAIPFPKPESEFDLLIGDWTNYNYKDLRGQAEIALNGESTYVGFVMNGNAPEDPSTGHDSTSFTVTKGKTYRFRISNVGTGLSFNFRIQNHTMVLVETEGSYTDKITLDTLDVHVGQSYSVLVTADQPEARYFIEAYSTQTTLQVWGMAILDYANATSGPHLPHPSGPDPMDRQFSMNQARSIKWNLTAGAARPNPQGTFNVSNVTLTQKFVLHSSHWPIGGKPSYTVNNVSYVTPDTPLKLADNFRNGSGVYVLDAFPVDTISKYAINITSVVTGIHKGWIEIVLQNDLDIMDSWHLDGFGVYLVGLGDGNWTSNSRSNYNLYDPVVRSTVQVYPKGWTAVYAYLDNPGMWNLRSQRLLNWYLGAELYIRVYDPDPNPAKERPPPSNLLFCGILEPPPAPPAPAPAPPAPAPAPHKSWSTTNAPSPYLFATLIVLLVSWFNF